MLIKFLLLASRMAEILPDKEFNEFISNETGFRKVFDAVIEEKCFALIKEKESFKILVYDK